MTDGLGASGEAVIDELFVLVYQPLELTLLRGDGVEAFDVEETQPLNIYRSTILGVRSYVRPRCQWITLKHTLSVLW